MERNKNLRYWLLVCGILNVVFYLLHDVIGARFYPGYNWMAQVVSDLTATDAPSRLIASELTKIHGIFSCVACTLICISAKELWKETSEKILRQGVYLFVKQCTGFLQLVTASFL